MPVLGLGLVLVLAPVLVPVLVPELVPALVLVPEPGLEPVLAQHRHRTGVG